MSTKNKIAFDFDGVIADTDSKKIEWFKKRKINIDKADRSSIYETLSKNMSKEQIDKLYQEMAKTIFKKETLMETEPISESIQTLKKLSKKYEVYIITSRTPQMIQPIYEWLEKYKLKQNIKEIISSSCEKKQDICKKKNISFLCDDDKRHLEENEIKTRVLFNPNSNSRQEQTTNISVKTWKEITKIC